MADAYTDADLVERLRLHRDMGPTKGSDLLGVSPRNFLAACRRAKAKGLTADTIVVDEVARLKTKLTIAEKALAATVRDNITAAGIRDEVYALAAFTPDPPKWVANPPSKKSHTGVPVTMWSDWHWGEVVSKEQMGGSNEFNRAIAKERVRRLVDSTIDIAKHHMVNPVYPGIVVCLGGDMITGTIHEELRETNEGTLQQHLLEVQEHLEAALTVMADTFGNVFVPCVVGNHGRMTLKPRAKDRVYQTFEWNLYCQLEKYFRNDKRIQFSIPTETDAHFTVLGHRFLLTHGDSLGVKGGDGIIGAIGPIARGVTKVGRSEAQIGRDFDTLLMGHYHTSIPRSDAIPVIVSGCLKGYDEYARLMLRVPYSRPSQPLFFVHEKHGITAQWQVYLEPRFRASTAPEEWVAYRRTK